MPYVVATIMPADGQERSPNRFGRATRLAALTIDGARAVAYSAIDATAPQDRPMTSDEQRADRALRLAVRDLPEHGGTVGPLADGSSIAVDYRTSNELRDAVGYVCAGPFPSPSEMTAIRNAYNARA